MVRYVVELQHLQHCTDICLSNFHCSVCTVLLVDAQQTPVQPHAPYDAKGNTCIMQQEELKLHKGECSLLAAEHLGYANQFKLGIPLVLPPYGQHVVIPL